MIRDSMIFYRSFYEAVKELPRDVQGEVLTAIMEYGLNGVTTEQLKPIAKAIFTLVKPQIDANWVRYKNGQKGGRPKTENEPNQNQTETESKPSGNRTQTKRNPSFNFSKPNENDNHNNNEYYNKNVNGDENSSDSPSLPEIDLLSPLLVGLRLEFAEYIRNCINDQKPIFLQKEIAPKTDAYFQLIKNIPVFKQTVKYQQRINEPEKDFELRIDNILVEMLRVQTHDKVEHKWENLNDLAQHAINFIKKYEKQNDGNIKGNPGKAGRAFETAKNRYVPGTW